ncbi:MAG TPA: GNAT family N-acetyltransferase [Candidatus Saccharimonadales bacterium]|nr:GNAT family N-acetyltransferase [Candidatus Saccharimonadales bacterium]
MNEVTFRNYGKDDYSSVKEILIEGSLYDETWDSEDALEKRISEKPDSIVLAVLDNRVVGCVYLVDDILPLIFRLAVKEKYRKKSIGKMLIEEASKRLKEHGHTEIGLFVDSKKEKLKEWYRRQGFQETESSWVGFYKKI